ncbi:MAG: hypothetical protein U0984_12190 [Prosthecobacter sp.]|nr:hypothetical protein [Prosthecobacter sp.]
MVRRIPRLFAICLFAGLPAAAESVRTFEKDVRPILKTYCFQCHGESGKKKGDLDVRLARFITRDDGG